MITLNNLRILILRSRTVNVWRLARLCTFAALCFALALAATQITRGDGRIAAVWPVNAVLLVILLKHRKSAWLSLLGAFSAGLVCANIAAGDKMLSAISFTAANIAEILTIALLLTYRKRARMISTRGISLFVMSAIVGCLVSTGIVILALTLLDSAPAAQDAVLWYSADFLGMILFAPVAWSLLDRSRKFRADGIDALTILSFILLCSVSLAVFVQSDFPLLFLVPPALVAMAFASGIKGAAVALLVVAGFAFPLTLAGHGPTSLMDADMKAKELVLQAFLAVNSIMALGVGAAVSDRRRLAAKLARSQDRLRIQMSEVKEALGKSRLAEKMSGVGHWTLNLKTSRVFWSPEVYAIHGVDPDTYDPSYADAIQFYLEPDRIMINNLVENGILKGDSWDFEATLIRQSDGQERRVQSFGECILDPDGRVHRICGVFRDITDETRLVAELAEREHQYRMLAEFSTDIVVQFGFDGKISYASPSCHILGVTQQEAIGMSTLDFVVEEDREYAASITRELFDGSDPDRTLRREFRVRTFDGHTIWLEGNPTLIRDDEGKPLYAVSTFRNVTDRRAREEALALARVEAEVASKAKADFLSNMSHEIRTPLNGILGFTQLMARTELGEDQSYHLDRITQAGKMLRHIVDDILDFSKIAAGQMELAPSRFSLNDVVTDSTALVSAARPNSDVTLSLDLDTDDQLMVICDETRLRQVLVNIVGNAMKFTKEGEVSVDVQKDEFGIRIIVSDTGPGIPADKLELVFEGFQQADSTVSRKFGGTGLGLSISRSLVELMGGKLILESEEGKGTVVTLELPEISDDSLFVRNAQHPLSQGSDVKVRIMIVDDVDINIELLQAGLSACGHHVSSFSSARDALEDLESGQHYDIILMDIQMPEMDGITAYRRIRASLPALDDVPIIALTAQALPEQVQEILDTGFQNYVAKPVDIDALDRLIGHTLKKPATANLQSGDHAALVLAEYRSYLQSMRPEFEKLLKLPRSSEAATAIIALANAMAASAEAIGLNRIASDARRLADTIERTRIDTCARDEFGEAVDAFYHSACREAA